MSMVHASRGFLKPASDQLLSEPAVVAGLARAGLPATRVDWDWLVADYDRIRDRIEAVFPDFFDYNARVRVKGGFRLRVASAERVWNTSDGKAQFLVAAPGAAGPVVPADRLTLTTIRSHDQYNTTIYGLNDRYRGITGRRDIVFANAEDLSRQGLAHGDRIDVVAGDRVLAGQTVVAHEIARGSVAAYFPEANCLIALDDYDGRSGTPSYKSVPVTLRASAAG